MNSHEERLSRARISLDGLSVGDSFGGFFEFGRPELQEMWQRTRTIPKYDWRFTDDTNMALSIYATLRRHKKINQDALAKDFAEHFDRSRGYGLGARDLLMNLQRGGDWRILAPIMFKGGSYGNGGAMRVAPLGAYFADDMPTLIENAILSAEITHTHPEGIAGTIAVAVAAGLAYNLREAEPIPYTNFIERILEYIPETKVREGMIKSLEISPDTLIWPDVVKILGNGSGISAQDTVPLVIWVAATCLSDYEKAMWQLVDARGDVDTTCAMVGGIVACYTGLEGIPKQWLAQREKLPTWTFEE